MSSGAADRLSVLMAGIAHRRDVQSVIPRSETRPATTAASWLFSLDYHPPRARPDRIGI